MDSSTLRKQLVKVRKKNRSSHKKQLLTAAMQKKRLIWGKKYKNWEEDKWRKVIFSDESHFEVHGRRSQLCKTKCWKTPQHL